MIYKVSEDVRGRTLGHGSNSELNKSSGFRRFWGGKIQPLPRIKFKKISVFGLRKRPIHKKPEKVGLVRDLRTSNN